MAPPSQSLRSSTHTFQPAFASSAPHASELTPLPTMTASYSAIDERSELLVGDEPTLAHPELLHAGEELRAALLRHVEPALLAEHEAALGADKGGRIRLDRRWIVELRRDRARLAPEERPAGDRLPRLERIAGQFLHAGRDVTDAREVEVGLHAVERAQRERDLAEVRVARAFAHAVDRAVHPRRTGADGCDSRCSCETEVVVAVEVDGHVSDELDRPADEIRDRLRRRDAERVDDDDLACACLDGRRVDAVVELGLRARRVDAEERCVDVVLGGEAHRLRDAAEHRVAVDADGVELQVGDRRLDHRGADAELAQRFEVGRDGAGEAPHLGAQAGAGDELDRVPVVLRHARESRLDAIDAELVEQACDFELLLRVEDDADGLLAVAQRRVVQADMPADDMAVVEAPCPYEIAQQRTTPSGKADSFSTPSAVTRKLSSTRRPPPPSQ